MDFFTSQYADWHQFFDNCSISPQHFYKTVQQGIEERKVPETQATSVAFLERGLLSQNRIYLQIERDWLAYHICVAPFGTGFFVSSRMLTSTRKSWPLLFIPLALAFLVPFFIFILFAVLQSPFYGLLFAFLSFPMVFLLFLGCVVLWGWWSRMTYYRLDTMAAFQEAIHRVLIEKVNQVIEAGGRKPLSAEESKPVLHKLLRRS